MHRWGSLSAEQDSYCMAAVKCRTTHAWSSEDSPPGCGCIDDLLYPTHNNFWINQKKKKKSPWNSALQLSFLATPNPQSLLEHIKSDQVLCKIFFFLNVPSFVLFQSVPTRSALAEWQSAGEMGLNEHLLAKLDMWPCHSICKNQLPSNLEAEQLKPQ